MEMKSLTPQQVASASGCSLRAAYHYVKGEVAWPPKIAAAVEDVYGISRLHLLYPDEYAPDGSRRAVA